MQFIQSSYVHNEIPEPTDSEGILKYLEKIGRLCYRSDDLIKDDSAEGFIERLKGRKHLAMLEHYIFTMGISQSIFDDIWDMNYWVNEDNIDYLQKIKFINITDWVYHDDGMPGYIISGSATAFNYLWECDCVKNGENKGMRMICEFLQYHHPHLMIHPTNDPPITEEIYHDKYSHKIRFLSRKEVKSLPSELRKVHDWMSVLFTVDRNITHEIVRHRPLVSYAQESTRYCNYDKKGLCFVLPWYLSDEDKQYMMNQDNVDEIVNTLSNRNDITVPMRNDAIEYFNHCYYISNIYTEFLNKLDKTPQESKGVLDHYLRASIHVTTFMGEWHHIFKMRASKTAYPGIQEVMVPLLNETIKTEDTIFDDLEYLVEEGSKWIH